MDFLKQEVPITLTSLIIITLSTLIIFLLLIINTLFSSNSFKNLPPGPPRLPIIGNLHQVGDKPHVSFTKLSQQYGPIISLKLGTQIAVVASSPDAARGILKTQDTRLSSRFVPTALHNESLLPHSLLFAPCNESWRSLRSLCRTELFTSSALEAQSSVREAKVDRLVEFLRRKQGEVINTRDVVFTTLFNGLSCMVFGKDLLDLETEHESFAGVKRSVYMILEYVARVKDVGSFFPVLERFDVQGIRRGGQKHVMEAIGNWKEMIEERRRHISSSSSSSTSVESKTFLDRLIQNGFSDDRINQYVTELFVAGTNTTTTALIWAMAEIVRNPDVMTKIKEEINREIKTDNITVSQLSKLTYLQACVKEALRLHAPVPFLLPRVAVETCEVMNYTIPKNARIFVNVWAIGRDPNVWNDPLCFKPERFLSLDMDFKGQNFEFLPFGSGKRMCPSLPLGTKSIELIIASLIHKFDWVLPNNEDPSMEDKFLFTLVMEKPLKIIFKNKHES